MKIIEPKISSDLEVKDKFEPLDESFYNCIFNFCYCAKLTFNAINCNI